MTRATGHPQPLLDACAETVTQANRTADWLVSRPLSRLAADGGRVPAEARDLIDAIDALTRVACRGCSAAGCPPDGVLPHQLTDAAVGAQLRVMAATFAEALATCGPGELTVAEVRRVADAALELRRRG